MSSPPNPAPSSDLKPANPPHHRTLATILKSPPTPSSLRALSILFPRHRPHLVPKT